MSARDWRLLAVWAVLAVALLLPAGLSPSAVPANFGDLYTYHFPLRHLLASTLQEGRLPFWNPYIMSGLPLLANPQGALFYPASLLSWLFPLPLAFSWDMLFHWIWGPLGLLLLARRCGASSLAAASLAAAYGLCPFLVYRIAEGIPTLLASLSWAPWCWLAWGSGVPGLLAAAWALQGLSGHPQFLLVNALAMGLWAVAARRREPLLLLAREGLLATLLAALQWPLTWEFMAHSVRRHWPAAFNAAYSVSPRDLLTLLRPGAFGDPIARSYAGSPSVFFECGALFTGVCGLALAAAGLGRRGLRPLLLLGVGLGLALGANSPLFPLLLKTPLGLLRTPARYELIALWGLLLLAGAGWSRIERRAPARGLRTLLALVWAAELLLWSERFLAADDARLYMRASPHFAERFGAQPLRVLTDPALANPNKSMMYRAMNVNGYEAFYLAGYPEYAARSEGRPAADPSRTYLRDPNTPQMRRLSVAVALRPGAFEPAPGAEPLVRFVDGEDRRAPGRVWHARPRPERWEVRAQVPPEAALLVAAQPLYPGWRATLNGVRVALQPWDGWLQSVSVPLGRPQSLRLRLEFSPTRWPALALLAAAAWALWLAVLARRLRAPKNTWRGPGSTEADRDQGARREHGRSAM